MAFGVRTAREKQDTRCNFGSDGPIWATKPAEREDDDEGDVPPET